MKRFLSYLYPVSKKVPSQYSGKLEVTWYDGKKYLNTKNANYSYGSLQEILKFGLEHINLDSISNCLLLGLGGGSVIDTLRNDFNFQQHITAVDIDPVVIAIAQREFQHYNSPTLTMVCADAQQFIFETTASFDLIIVDLYIDAHMPSQFMESAFWKAILQSHSNQGAIIFNAALNVPSSKSLQAIKALLETAGFSVSIHQKVNGTNTLLIAQTS
ncbi:spermidine synthase [Mangrovimonas sp. YM274]|uniref:spermidine synthase n=1 Tax=Mangrovimonas sp. YM274 TaxID=3070660 RepID=UPI0027DB7176|nr:fused MFS/spermidine synthase [Mangrovimonas sp. YM274]WMI69196.1 fused MFS/spermidine synthase [Mangrovimonas sp. YM274]